MTQEEFILSMAATAVTSPLLVEAFKRLADWMQGRTSRIAAIQEALNDAETELIALQRSHRDELDDQLRRQRELELEIHHLKLRLMSLGVDPGEL